MVSQDLLDILRCPACVRNGPNAGLLDFIEEQWLVCRDCDRKYPGTSIEMCLWRNWGSRSGGLWFSLSRLAGNR